MCRRICANSFAQAVVLLLISVALAAAVNLVRPKAVPWDNRPAFEMLPHIELMEALGALEAGDCLFLDARPPSFYKLGRILNAISVPLETPETDVKSAVPLQHPYRQIIIYCEDENCDAADTMARRMKRMGYDRLLVMEGGWRAWTQAHLPSE